MKVTVAREHANSGDCLVSIDGGEPFHIPGDVTAFTALRMLGPWLEEQTTDPLPKVATATDAVFEDARSQSSLVHNEELDRAQVRK